jgi:serine/threonine protein phosphatase 1
MPTYAIGDLHGCLRALEKMLDAVRPASDDTVILMGDYVNRGPNSRGVIDRILYLRNATRLVALRGNHDATMIAAREKDDLLEGWLRMGGDATLESYPGRSLEGVPPDHWDFLMEFCRDWYETDGHIFVHASVDPKREMPDQSTRELHWQRLDPKTKPHRSGKTVICAHTAQHDGRPVDLGHTICIDTGCVYGLWLTCLEIETGRYWQTSEDPEVTETREGSLG